MTDPALAEQHQKLDAGERVVLWKIDVSQIGGDLVRLTSGPWDGAPVLFDGELYAPIPIEADGFEWSAQGALPTPQLSLSNVNSAFVPLILGTADMLGAVVQRIRTFKRFLDDGEDPNPGAVMTELYRVERKVEMTSTSLVLELASVLDHEGVMLPRRVALRNSCTHRYRRWDDESGAFDYGKATCPYVADAFFDRDGDATTQANDRCGKRLSDCRRRFGQHGILPFRGFPGMGQIR